MTSRDFCYWLQGLLELGEVTEFNSKQVEILKNHLAMVFVHEIDPSFGDKQHQNKLNHLHNSPIINSPIIKC
jgi:hypothetical protein